MAYRIHYKTRRAIALLGGLTLPIGALVWGFAGSGPAAKLFGHQPGLASQFGENAMYAKSVGAAFIGVVGLCIATGLSFGLLFWEMKPSKWRQHAVFWIFLAFLLPCSVLNYFTGDYFVNRTTQALVDVVLVFLGIVTVWSLLQIRLTSFPLSVLRAMAAILIVLQSVFIPGFFALVWLLNFQTIISLPATKEISASWISAIAAIGSLAVSVLTYRLAVSKAKADTDAAVLAASPPATAAVSPSRTIIIP